MTEMPLIVSDKPETATNTSTDSQADLAEFDPMVSFRPPKVGVGDRVCWYPMARRNAIPIPGIVTEVASRIVTVCTMDGRHKYTSVRHVDDPKNIKESQAVNGAWDFPAADKQLRADIDEMRANLKTVMDQLGIKPSDVSTAAAVQPRRPGRPPKNPTA